MAGDDLAVMSLAGSSGLLARRWRAKSGAVIAGTEIEAAAVRERLHTPLHKLLHSILRKPEKA